MFFPRQDGWHSCSQWKRRAAVTVHRNNRHLAVLQVLASTSPTHVTYDLHHEACDSLLPVWFKSTMEWLFSFSVQVNKEIGAYVEGSSPRWGENFVEFQWLLSRKDLLKYISIIVPCKSLHLLSLWMKSFGQVNIQLCFETLWSLTFTIILPTSFIFILTKQGLLWYVSMNGV